jgi:hypothetical protein
LSGVITHAVQAEDPGRSLGAATPGRAAAPHAVLALQRAAGNRATGAVLQRAGGKKTRRKPPAPLKRRARVSQEDLERSMLIQAAFMTIENIGDRLENALVDATPASGSTLSRDLLGWILGATVAGAIARLVGRVVVEAIVSEFLQDVAKKSVEGIAADVGGASVDPKRFINTWKIKQRTVLRDELVGIARASASEFIDPLGDYYEERRRQEPGAEIFDAPRDPADLAAALRRATVDFGEVEDEVLKRLLTLYLRAVRSAHDRDPSGYQKGALDMEITPGVSRSRLQHCDIMGFENGDFREVNRAFRGKGIDIRELELPVVFHVNYGRARPASNSYAYARFDVVPLDAMLGAPPGRLLLGEHIKYSDSKFQMEGMKVPTRGNLSQFSFPVPAAFGDNVSVVRREAATLP